jgi:hypothetical protein
MLVREIDSKRCLPCARDDEVDIGFDDNKSATKNRYCAMARIRSLSRLIRSKGSECGHWPRAPRYCADLHRAAPDYPA